MCFTTPTTTTGSRINWKAPAGESSTLSFLPIASCPGQVCSATVSSTMATCVWTASSASSNSRPVSSVAPMLRKYPGSVDLWSAITVFCCWTGAPSAQ